MLLCLSNIILIEIQHMKLDVLPLELSASILSLITALIFYSSLPDAILCITPVKNIYLDYNGVYDESEVVMRYHLYW